MAIPNPPIFDDSNPPAALQVLRLNAAGTAWEPAAITAAAVTVPQAHIAGGAAPSAKTAVTVVAADAATQSGSYVQADVQTIATLANSLKTQLNAAVADIGTLVTELTADVAKLATTLTELQTAGVLSAS